MQIHGRAKLGPAGRLAVTDGMTLRQAAGCFGVATVFFVAGIAKLTDRPGTQQALADFDVPRRLAGPLLLLLPAAESLMRLALHGETRPAPARV
jgi:hypothetical protein